jgi:GMC oxidoreductase/Domain of Unknown Function (DUF1080)
MGGHGIAPHDPHEVGSTWHDSGTLFLGDDPGASVTDTSGRFHHIANAACVDQALFPTVGSANPVLTGLCLARKAAEAIVARHVSAPAPDAGEVAAEKAAGFVFLLEPAEAGKWMPNNARHTASRPALIEGGTIIEVHGDAGPGVLFYDEPAPFQDFELRLQWKAFLDGGPAAEVADSGVFLRAPRPRPELDDASFYGQAIEIQIDDTGTIPTPAGSAVLCTGRALFMDSPRRAGARKRS